MANKGAFKGKGMAMSKGSGSSHGSHGKKMTGFSAKLGKAPKAFGKDMSPAGK